MCFNSQSTSNPAPYSLDNSQSAVKQTVTPVTEADKNAAAAAVTSSAASQANSKQQTGTSGLNVR